MVAIEADDPAEALLDAHLRLARKRARHWGVSVQTTVLDGAASEVLNKHLEDSGAWLVVLGRHGSDVDDGETEPGSLIDHIMRYGPCNTLIVNSTYRPNSTLSADSNNLQVV